MSELKAAAASGNLFGSMAHGHANPASVKNAIYDVITAAVQRRVRRRQPPSQELVSAVELAQ